MELSVIIPTCHRNDLLALCLERLAPEAQTLGAVPYEVIVTDDGSARTAEQMVKTRFPWVRWTQGPRRGPAANRNHGAKLAASDWLVFVDDDCLPSENYLMVLSEVIERLPMIEVIEGKTHADKPKSRMDEVSPINETGGFLWSCNFAIHKNLFSSLSGFDEEFPHAAMEDVDLRLRLMALQKPIYFAEHATICHPWRRHGGLKSVNRSIESHRIFWHKHPEHLWVHSPGVYINLIIKTLVRTMIPEIFTFGGKGLPAALCDLLIILRLAILSHTLRRQSVPTKLPN